MNKEKIVIFDFDGTITNRDTMLDMALKNFGLIKFIHGLLMVLPKILTYKLGLISNKSAKEAFLSQFYNNMKYEEFLRISTEYSLKEIDKILKSEAIKKINFYKSKGYKLIIISASIEEWLRPWAIKHGFEAVLSSKILVENQKIVGKLDGKNCYGKEKLNRFISHYGPPENYHLITFGDSKGDKEILEISNESYYKKYE